MVSNPISNVHFSAVTNCIQHIRQENPSSPRRTISIIHSTFIADSCERRLVRDSVWPTEETTSSDCANLYPTQIKFEKPAQPNHTQPMDRPGARPTLELVPIDTAAAVMSLRLMAPCDNEVKVDAV